MKEAILSLNKRRERLEQARTPWETTWDEVSKYVVPRRSIYESEDQIADLGRDIFDTTAIRSCQILVDGLMGYSVNASMDWFRFRIGKSWSKLDKAVQTWLFELEKHIYSTLGKSNFYEAVSESITNAASIGTCLCSAEEDLEAGKIRFMTWHHKEYWLAENHFCIVDTVFRKVKMERRRLDERFKGKELPEKVKNDDNMDREYTVYHAVFKVEGNEYGLETADVQGKPWASVYWLEGFDDLISCSGYDSFPYAAWRWRRNTREVYGHGPGLDNIHEILMLNQMNRDILVKSQIDSMGLWDAPASMKNDGITIEPGKIVYSRSPGHRLQRIDSGGNIGEGLNMLQDRRDIVSKAFQIDVFMMMQSLQGGQMTAQEVIERTGEKAAILAASMSRMNTEFLDPLLNIVLNIELIGGRLPPPPKGMNMESLSALRVEYVGPLAQAQKRFHETSGITKAFAHIAPFFQVKADIGDVLKLDNWVRGLAESDGVPPDGIRDEKEVEQIRQARQRAQAQAQQAQQLMELAKVAPGLGKTPEQGSVGQQLTEAMNGNRP